jgi:hypothetical protein
MKKQMAMGSVGLVILALGGWVYLAGQGNAGEAKGLKEGVLKVAEILKKGDMAAAAKQAALVATKVEDLEDLMALFKKRDKGGIGVGPKAGVAAPDGIEAKLNSMGRDSPSAATLKKEGDALEDMGYVVAAMALVTKAKPAPKAKTKDWNGWCDDMVAAGGKLSAAAKTQTSADLKTASSKINASCNACHSAYRK